MYKTSKYYTLYYLSKHVILIMIIHTHVILILILFQSIEPLIELLLCTYIRFYYDKIINRKIVRK